MEEPGTRAAAEFISDWSGVTASELSTSQTFLANLCRLLGVPAPHPTAEQDYMFERPITFAHGDSSTSAGRIDLYRRGAFVLESKKLKAAAHTARFDAAMLGARSQAESYARALPAAEGRPPFLVVVDVGNRIELYAEFSRSGATYTPFPDPRSHRIALEDLRKPEIRERLRKVWMEPLALDPSREAARVTREIAARLATLARSLELSGHAPELVAQFLMRCLFTMFAEDVKLLPDNSFRDLLRKHLDQPDTAMRMLGLLWRDMDSGGFSGVLAGEVLRFNGKLFKHPDTLPLNREQIALLVEAASAKWEHVEPAIFGTLLERALTPGERHKLGAHYTPRAYVERLVLPTVIEPLRSEWSDAQAAALTLASENKRDDAIAELRRFHHRLCSVRVLDPACGSGNFLYVTLEHLKRLEGEVLNALDELGWRQTGLALGGERADAHAGETVDPHNLLGIELNPRAAAIAEVVLWIGYLQWHFRTRGDVQPPQPVIRDFRNIENRDAVLACDRVEYVTDERGIPVTRWDGKTMKVSPVTGEEIPDETARVALERYVNPRKATWPEADFVVGNPPFIGNKRMRTALGDGYAEALREAWPDVPESADFVMYWWHHAAQLTRRGTVERFGLITTNSIRQSFNRKIIEAALLPSPASGRGAGGEGMPLSLVLAIPDHPWVDSAEGAAVRIAMSVGAPGSRTGRALSVSAETEGSDGEVICELSSREGRIHPDLSAGAAIATASELAANRGLAFTGMYPLGQGFVLLPDQRDQAIGTDRDALRVVKPFVIARDLTQRSRQARVIDFYPRSADEARLQFPSLFQWVLNRVKPERDQNPVEERRRNWWLFTRPIPALRGGLKDLVRYIVVPRTAKWFSFQFVGTNTIPDTSVVAIASDDALQLGVLSSVTHLTWAVASGGTLEDRPRYQHQRTFNPFPFPDLAQAPNPLSPSPSPARGRGELMVERIRTLGEQLDAHRKRQQSAHPDLTLTGMYNVLEKLRSGESLTVKERAIHEQGLVSVLRQVHDELDAAVLEAYGWSDLLPLLRIAHGLALSRQPSPPAGLRGTDSMSVPRWDPPPLPHAGEGSESLSRDDAKRAFDEAILERLVALNTERAAEEARGRVRWLRPDFQNPQAQAAPRQGEIDTGAEEPDEMPAEKPKAGTKALPWPKDAIDQVRAVAEMLVAAPSPMSVKDIAAGFSGRGSWKKRLPALLEMLVVLGRARLQDARYSGLR